VLAVAAAGLGGGCVHGSTLMRCSDRWEFRWLLEWEMFGAHVVEGIFAIGTGGVGYVRKKVGMAEERWGEMVSEGSRQSRKEWMFP
jgi:hypothetical protein